MIRLLFILSFLLACPFILFAQGDNILLSGKVVDKVTQQPIPVVRISSSLERVSTNEQGEFIITVKEGDQLTFVHLSYQPFLLQVSVEGPSFQLVELEERVLEMREFEVNDFPTEQAFKEAMMNASPSKAGEIGRMQRNVLTICEDQRAKLSS